MARRIGIGGIWHETNTFARGLTELDDFMSFQYADGPDEFASVYEGTRHEIGGVLDGCNRHGVQPVCLVAASSIPGATVSAAAYRTLSERILERLEASLPLDALVLTLHGAMVAEGIEDPESDFALAARQLVADIPIAITLDLHANPGAGVFAAGDHVVGYDTYPHVDQFERGQEAVDLVVEMLDTGRRPRLAWRRLPLLTCPLSQASAEEPGREIISRAHRLEERPEIACVTVLPGYAYADVPELGFTIAVSGYDPDAVEAGADELAETVWDRRELFARELLSPEEAVARALQEGDRPIVLADVSDNVGGGTPGDGTAILAVLLAAGAREAVVVLCDPEAAQLAADAGVGQTVELSVGGKWDDLHGPPIDVNGKVVRTGEVRYRRTGSFHTGVEVDMGLCAVVEVDGTTLVLTSQRIMPFDSDHLVAVGVDPQLQRLIVTKSAIAWRAAFGDLAAKAYYVDGPGVCTCRLSSFDYKRVSRPVVPLDSVEEPLALAISRG